MMKTKKLLTTLVATLFVMGLIAPTAQSVPTDGEETGFYVFAGEAPKSIDVYGQCFRVSSTNQDYFLPTSTQEAWDSFVETSLNSEEYSDLSVEACISRLHMIPCYEETATGALYVGEYEVVSVTRVSEDEFHYTLRGFIANDSNLGDDYEGITATYSSEEPGVSFPEENNKLSFGAVAAGQEVWSSNTIVMQFNSTNPFVADNLGCDVKINDE